MLIDLEKVAEPMATQNAAVCIAGAGIAGLVLATTLADAGIEVHLLEAGGRSLEDRSQQVYDAEMARLKHTGTTEGRFRVFGGSSTRWGGQILPLSQEVFTPGPDLSSSAWPITPDALEPFYSTIEQLFGTDHLPFTTEVYKALGIPAPPELTLNPNFNLRFSKWAPFSHRNVARTLGQRAIASSKITIFLHANVTECLLSPDGSRIQALLVRNYRGDRFRFEAGQHVLAAGTIETNRLLLASRSVCARGVGNAHGQVGRGIHDHVSAPVAELSGEARQKLPAWLGPFFSGSTRRTGRLEASTELRRRLDLLSVMAHITVEEPEDSGAFLARQFLRFLQRGELRSAILDTLPRLPAASLEIFRLAYYAKIRKRRALSPRAVVSLRVDCEQRPIPQNCIRLSDKTDSLDMPKAIVDWHAAAEEIRTLQRYANWLRGEFDRLGVNGINWRQDLSSGAGVALGALRDTNHLMGGAMMGMDPLRSVVDTNLRVHGLSNLFVASLSTYPAGGSSNPTFTLVALTLRLAERLKAVAAQPAASIRTRSAVLTAP